MPLLLLSLATLLSLSCAQFFGQPEQVHISYGSQPSEMVVSWVTLSNVNTSVVEFGIKSLMTRVNGNVSVFTDGGSERRVLYMHRVLLQGLIPSQRYLYHCGSDIGWSEVFSFTTMKSGSQWSPRFAIFGDLGNVNAQSLPRLQEETQKGMYDAFLHVGDFAYNMDTDNALVGDEFMRQIESIAAYMPYMTCVGNHENAWNFSNYVNRFNMPRMDGSLGGDNNFFYSINIGPVHLIGISTEFYYYVEYGWLQIARQFEWLENDLKEANKPENRALRPWIITMGHRPMYCSNDDGDDCTHKYSLVREGIPLANLYGLEDLLYKYGVDVMLWAHEHSYERLFPVYNRRVCNGSYTEPYTEPGAPVHIITGSAGCQEKHDTFGKASPPWTAFRTTDYGYTRMTVHNTTHMYFEQVSDDKGGVVIDKAWVKKSQHGAGLYQCH